MSEVISFSIESIELAIVFQIVEYIPVFDKMFASEVLQHRVDALKLGIIQTFRDSSNSVILEVIEGQIGNFCAGDCEVTDSKVPLCSLVEFY